MPAKPGRLEGAYRGYTWHNGQAAKAGENGVTETHVGWGLSLDQAISSHTTLVARYGHSTTGTVAFDRAWTVGGQVTGVYWGRPDDRFGLAYGQLKSSGVEATATGSEKIIELFYAIQPHANLQLTPSVQKIRNVAGTGEDVTVYALRAKASF